MKKIIFLFLVFLESCTTDTPVSIFNPPDYSPMWRQFGGDARHTGNPNSPKVPLPPVMNGMVDWVDTVTNNYPNDGSECAVDSKGNIYFLSTGTYQIIKYDLYGNVIWKRDTEYMGAFSGVTISADETKIYYPDFEKIVCRDSSGNLIWQINERCIGGSIIDDENNIYVSNNDKLTKISPSGNKLWTINDIYINYYSPAFDRYYNIYFPGKKNDRNVLAKVDRDGRVLWVCDLNNSTAYPSRSLVIDGYNNIYYSHEKLYCISKDGTVKWNQPYGGMSVPALTKDNKLIIKTGFGFVMLDTAGNTLWAKNISISTNESNILIDDKDNIYYNYWINNFSVISLDKAGNVRWDMQNFANGLVIPSPALMPGGKLFTYPKRPSRVYCIK